MTTKGFGLRTNPFVHQVAKAAGISDLSAKVYGSRNPMRVIKLAVQMLHGGTVPLGAFLSHALSLSAQRPLSFAEQRPTGPRRLWRRVREQGSKTQQEGGRDEPDGR